MTKFLITGHKSGLGRYLYELFGGIGFDRSVSSDKFEQIKRDGVDIIIHCAAQPPKDITLSSLYSFIDDNVLFTDSIVSIPHKKFIFISSVDVYPKSSGIHDEDEDISLETMTNFYAATKLMSESIVMKKSTNNLILRCAALLGVYSRQNSLIKIAQEHSPAVTLSASSDMNYVLHKQIADFIRHALEKNLSGVYNVASSQNITLKRVSDILEKRVSFGSYRYNVGNISNEKISSIFPTFKKTSQDVVREFIKEDLRRRK